MEELSQYIARRGIAELGSPMEEATHVAVHRTNYAEGGSATSSGATTANRNIIHLLQGELGRRPREGPNVGAPPR